jgi:hypothetical protein
MPPRDPDDAVVPFPNAAPPLARGSTALAIVLAITSAIVELGKLAMWLAFLALAGFGLASLLR